MAVAIPENMREVLRIMGRHGGKVRAQRYTKEQLAAWGKLGGRPKKDRAGGMVHRAPRGDEAREDHETARDRNAKNGKSVAQALRGPRVGGLPPIRPSVDINGDPVQPLEVAPEA